ncbi:MAG: hypothetical protein V4681_00705 [Patescibacteria group bacterium]
MFMFKECRYPFQILIAELGVFHEWALSGFKKPEKPEDPVREEECALLK